MLLHHYAYFFAFDIVEIRFFQFDSKFSLGSTSYLSFHALHKTKIWNLRLFYSTKVLRHQFVNCALNISENTLAYSKPFFFCLHPFNHNWKIAQHIYKIKIIIIYISLFFSQLLCLFPLSLQPC